mgnify:CR=1 FL=1
MHEVSKLQRLLHRAHAAGGQGAQFGARDAAAQRLGRAHGNRVVVRAGRPGLAAFDWLPSAPGFGDVVADPGLSRSMVAPKAWGRLRDRDVVTSLGGWGQAIDRVLEPRLAALVAYAQTGDAGKLITILLRSLLVASKTKISPFLATMLIGSCSPLAKRFHVTFSKSPFKPEISHTSPSKVTPAASPWSLRNAMSASQNASGGPISVPT